MIASTRIAARLRVARRPDGRWYAHVVEREFVAPKVGRPFWTEDAIPVGPGHTAYEDAMTAAVGLAMDAAGDMADIIVRKTVRPGNPDDAPF